MSSLRETWLAIGALLLAAAADSLRASDADWPADRPPAPRQTASAEPGGAASLRAPSSSRDGAVPEAGETGDRRTNDGAKNDTAQNPEEKEEEEDEAKKDRKPSNAKTIFRWSGQEYEDEDEEEVEPIATDRPDFTEASSTVGKGVFQIETGYTFIEDRGNDGVVVQTHSWGEPLFRLGVFHDWLELRLAAFPVTERSTEEGTTSGVEDLYLGVKLALTEQSGWLPEMALTPQMTVPTGSSQFQNYATLAGINWLYGWDISECLSTAGSTQVNKAIDDDGDSYLEFAQSWTIGYTLTEKFGAYTEWFAFLPSGTQIALAEHYFDGGFTYKFTKDVQWDIRGGIGLNDAAANYFVGTGLSVRYR